MLKTDNSVRNFTFSFFPYFQTQKDLDYLIEKFMESTNLSHSNLKIEGITTVFDFVVGGKKAKNLNTEIKNQEFLYIYFDNLIFYSEKNISCLTLGISSRSDNFISNRGVYSTTEFTGDAEELIFMSKAIRETFTTNKRKVVLGGDYFTNSSIPNEYKLNLISEILSSGIYEVYIDRDNSFPNYINLKSEPDLDLKNVSFDKFTYLLTSEKDLQLMFEQEGKNKYLNLPFDETYFLYFDNDSDLKLKFKGKDIGKIDEIADRQFAGMFIDRRRFATKKDTFGIENFRKVLASIEKENDYSSL